MAHLGHARSETGLILLLAIGGATLMLVAIGGATLMLAGNLLAAVPAAVALRTGPATALRAE